MNRRVLPLVVGSLILTVGCRGSDDPTGPEIVDRPFCSGQPVTAIPTFPDANLKAAIRAALGLSARDHLTCGVVAGLTDFTASDAGITSLLGIRNLTNLKTLSLDNNSITDISTLSGLTSLTYLDLNNNPIADISPLSGLTSLRKLWLDHTPITDISPLSGLTGLTGLHIYGNAITVADISFLSAFTSLRELTLALGEAEFTDISALGGLTHLALLSLGYNLITDISPLSGLTTLHWLDLRFNEIADISALSGLANLRFLFLDNNESLSNIQPLLDNTGLGAGDIVGLSSASVSCPDVAALQGKGVTVTSDCS